MLPSLLTAIVYFSNYVPVRIRPLRTQTPRSLWFWLHNQTSKPDQLKCCPGWRNLSFGRTRGTGWSSVIALGVDVQALLSSFQEMAACDHLEGFSSLPSYPSSGGTKKRTCFLFQERSRYYKMVQTILSGPQGELYQIQRSLKFPWFGAGNSIERVALFPYFCCHCRCCRKSRVIGGGGTWSHWWRGCWSLKWFNRQVPTGSQVLTCHTMLGSVVGPLS